MIIKKLEIQGFKSFPEKTRIIFHPGITCIIGPNGTGKSNIVDSMIWALGGKRHRIAKSERRGDIIFTGNTEKAPMSLADVTLSLSEDSEEMKINHRMFRSGESEYRLDGKIVRLKDIQKNLWEKSINESDYFVIEQGAIGTFLSLKPIEKRSLLEDAAGTAFYKDRKKQAQNKLESSEQNLIRLEDIIAEVSRAKNSLKRQAAAAIRYRKIREDIRRLTSLNFRIKIDDLEKQQDKIIKSYNTSSDREKAAQLNLKDKENDLTKMRAQVWETEKKIKEEQENLYSTKSRLSQLESEKERENKRVDFIKEKKDDTQFNIKELKQELDRIAIDLSDARSSHSSLSDSLEKKQQKLSQAEKISHEIQSHFDKERKLLEGFREDYLQAISGQTELKNEAAKLERESELISQQEQKLKSQLETEKAQLEESEKKTTGTKILLNDNKENLKNQENSLEIKLKDLEDVRNSIVQLQEKISRINSIREKHEHHLSVLKELAAKEGTRDHLEPVSQTLGVMADFLETDPQNTPLIDMFWKNEVKADVIEAEKALDLLKENPHKKNLLLLHPEERDPLEEKVFQDPQVLGRLTSRVRVKGKLKKHLSQLAEAAVVKDIKTAVQLWIQYPRVNFIALSGDALLSSGYLKFKEEKEGYFAVRQEIASVQQKMEKAEADILPIKTEINEYSEQEQALIREIEKLQEEKENLKNRINELERSSHQDTSEIKMIRTNIEIISKEIAVYTKDKKNLEAKTDSLASELAKISLNEKSLKDKIAQQEKVLPGLQEKNSSARNKVFEYQSELEIVRERIKNLEQRADRLEERKNSSEKKIKSLEKIVSDSDDDTKQCRENIQSLSQEINDQTKTIKEKESLLLQIESELKTSKDTLSEKEKALDSIREDLDIKKDSRVDWEVKKAEMERDRINLEESCWQELKKNIEEVKQEVSLETLEDEDVAASLQEANEKLQKFSSVNLMAEEEYLVQKKRYDFLLQEQEDLRNSIDSTRQAIKKIDKESKALFLDALEEVNKNFKDIFSLLFEGGKAELKLAEPETPLESGIDIIAQPPGKKVQNLNLLSGGEKTLTSLAFFFALFRYKPTPFCVLDEVDAALDDINLSRFLNLMKKIKDQTQFIIITHNYKTMEVADYIYGTTMAEPNITSLYSVKIDSKGKANIPDMESKSAG